MKLNEIIFAVLKYIYEKVQGPTKHYYALSLYKDGKLYLKKKGKSQVFLPVLSSTAGTPLFEYSPDVPIEVYLAALKKTASSQLEHHTQASILFGSKAYNMRPFLNSTVTLVVAKVEEEPNSEWEAIPLSSIPLNKSEGLLYDIITEEISNFQEKSLI